MTDAQRFSTASRPSKGSGLFLGVMISLVFLVVAAGFGILGFLFLTMPNPPIVIGLIMLVGAVATVATSLGGIVFSIRALLPARG